MAHTAVDGVQRVLEPEAGTVCPGQGHLVPDVRLDVDLACYPMPAVWRACYAFTDQAYVWLEPAEPGSVSVCLARIDPDQSGRDLAGQFRNALIDFALRHQIQQETATVRDCLVQAALGGVTRS